MSTRIPFLTSALAMLANVPSFFRPSRRRPVQLPPQLEPEAQLQPAPKVKHRVVTMKAGGLDTPPYCTVCHGNWQGAVKQTCPECGRKRPRKLYRRITPLRDVLACLILLLALVGASSAQTTANVSASHGGVSQTHQFALRPVSSVSFALSNTQTNATGAGVLEVSIATSRLSPAAVQFELQYQPTEVTLGTITAGPAAEAAGKTATCAAQSATVTRCLVVGLNEQQIANGVVARVPVQATAASTVILLNPISATRNGRGLDVSVASGGGVVTYPIVLSGLACDLNELEPGEGSVCTVTLSRATAEAASVPVTLDAGLAGPAAVVVPAGTDTATFTVSGAPAGS